MAISLQILLLVLLVAQESCQEVKQSTFSDLFPSPSPSLFPFLSPSPSSPWLTVVIVSHIGLNFESYEDDHCWQSRWINYQVSSSKINSSAWLCDLSLVHFTIILNCIFRWNLVIDAYHQWNLLMNFLLSCIRYLDMFSFRPQDEHFRKFYK